MYVLLCHLWCIICILPVPVDYVENVEWTFCPIHPITFFVQRLAAGEWFTARVSACGLFHIAYPSAPETAKTELRSIYSQLCQDDMPMVRRSAASNLGKFAATVEYAHLKADIMSIFDDLTQDGKWIHIFTLFFIESFCHLSGYKPCDLVVESPECALTF